MPEDELNRQTRPVNATDNAKAGDVRVERKLDEQKQSKGWGKKILATVMAVLGVTILICGGMLTGVLWQQKLDAGKSPESNSGTETETDQLIEGGGGGKLVGDVALIPQDDQLTLGLLKLHNVQENSCFSSLSVRYALEMLREGTEGETKAQIDQLLGTTTTPKYENVAEHLSVANALWLQDEFAGAVKTEYVDALRNKFGAEVKQDSFQSAVNINRWIEDESFGMLKDVMQDSDVRSLQVLLANVLAIDMDWENKFLDVSTDGHYFNYNSELGETNPKYTTMQGYGGNDEYYNLAAEATVFAKDLKEYNGTQLQFVAIMPSGDLTNFIQNLSNEQINRLLIGMRRAVRQNDTYNFSFASYIPKFSISSGIDDLIADLKTLGVTEAFEPGANLSKITEAPLTIGKALQKTQFDFSEDGIRAAAVTMMGGFGAGGDGPIPSSVRIVVSINKPFLYLVRDAKTGDIWFVGTVYEPNLWENDHAQYGRPY